MKANKSHILNKKSTNFESEFGIHEKTNRMTIKILDKDTRKVIKEFPAEKSLDLIAKAMEMAGILVDEKRQEAAIMAIRLTGLASGLDTDSMVKELVSAYSKKQESIVKKKTKLEWKQD